MRGLDLGFGLRLHVLVDGRSGFVRLVDRRGLGLLLGESIALLEGGDFEVVDAVENAIEFGFEAIVRLEIEPAAEELVEGGVEVRLGGLEMAVAIVVLAGLVFLFDAGDEVADRIDGERLCGLRGGLRVRLWTIQQMTKPAFVGWNEGPRRKGLRAPEPEPAAGT